NEPDGRSHERRVRRRPFPIVRAVGKAADGNACQKNECGADPAERRWSKALGERSYTLGAFGWRTGHRRCSAQFVPSPLLPTIPAVSNVAIARSVATAV